jgi:hypothetical protein
MKASTECNDDRAVSDVDQPVVELDETIDLTVPVRHFHRALKGRSLTSGPLANPLRTRLV